MSKYKITCDMRNGLVFSTTFDTNSFESNENIVVKGLSIITTKTQSSVFSLSEIKNCKVEFVDEEIF